MKHAANPIYSISPFTALDYPDKTACILWFAGCNMQCAYCYNPVIVNGKGKISYNDAFDFLKTRRNLLDGVVLSGGECTIHKNLEQFALSVKGMGFRVKIDTNGCNPTLIRSMVRNRAVDYIALDFKALPGKFNRVTGTSMFEKFRQTLSFLIDIDFPFEVRTTVHSSLLCSEDLQKMILFLEELNYQGTYYLQPFLNDATTLQILPYSSSIHISKLINNIKIVIRG